jgi:hypothetical protein
VLAERLVRARRIQNQFALAVRSGAATVEEKLGVDRAVLDMASALTEARRAAAVEKARVSVHVHQHLAHVLSEFRQAARDVARAENELRRSRAFATSLYAQSVLTTDNVGHDTRLGVKATYALGSLFTGPDEQIIVDASSTYAMQRIHGAPQIFLTLSRIVSVERREARTALTMLRAEHDKFVSKIRELEPVATERSRRHSDVIRLQLYALEADSTYHESLETEFSKLNDILDQARG